VSNTVENQQIEDIIIGKILKLFNKRIPYARPTTGWTSGAVFCYSRPCKVMKLLCAGLGYVQRSNANLAYFLGSWMLQLSLKLASSRNKSRFRTS